VNGEFCDARGRLTDKLRDGDDEGEALATNTKASNRSSVALFRYDCGANAGALELDSLHVCTHLSQIDAEAYNMQLGNFSVPVLVKAQQL